jgi:hypothetical protein
MWKECTGLMEDEDIPINFADNAVEMIAEWLESDDGGVGACLLCGTRYYSQGRLR